MAKSPAKETPAAQATEEKVVTADAPSDGKAVVAATEDTEGKAVAAIVPGGAVEVAQAAADLFQEYANAGMEKVTSKDWIIPRLGILQSLSPQLKKNNSDFIEGASEGDICDVSTGEVFESPLHFLPVVWDKVWLEWYPRATQKGLANIHTTDDIMKHTRQNERRQWVLSNGNLIAETCQFYGLNLSAGRRPSFIPLTSTQLQKSRRWISLARAERIENPTTGDEFCPPLFYRSYYLSTAAESNAEGEWSGWVINRGPSILELPSWKNIRLQAIEFRESIIASIAKGDLSNMTDDPSTIDGEAVRTDRPAQSDAPVDDPPPNMGDEGRM